MPPSPHPDYHYTYHQLPPAPFCRLLPVPNPRAARHVPSLQPQPPPDALLSSPAAPASASAASASASAAVRAYAAERRRFALLITAVCSSLVPKVPSFGPRAITNVVAGLGAMGIR